MLTFSTAVLLAVICLFARAGGSAYTVTTCEDNNVHRLSCESGVISVLSALYGRADTQTCSEGKPPGQISNTSCSKRDAEDALKKRCDGKKECELTAEDLSGPDPCVDTFKYLQTNFICLPAIHQETCEHSLAHLQCDAGQVISILNADYGRRDQTTCSYRRPINQITNVYCSHPTSKVADSCNGKNSCTIEASNSVFGDPCEGTYKYLEVAYVCEYPVSYADESR